MCGKESTMTELPWEDSLLERKLESDTKDLLRTFVAFANSVRPGHVAAVLIGEKDDGSVQGVTDPDKMQKRVREECEKIYPDIIWRSSVYEKEAKHCVRVEIEYSGETPHFGGAAWIRRNSESVKANEEMFQRLIDLRLGMVRELSQWLEKDITVGADPGTAPSRVDPMQMMRLRWWGHMHAKLSFVNSFWATFELYDKDRKITSRRSEPLEKLMLNWHDEERRLLVLVRP